MSTRHLQIDISTSKYSSEGDLIKLQLKNEDIIQINFSKLVSQSKYIRDKYKYSEILEYFQTEIEDITTKFTIKTESIKYFFQIIQDQKFTIPIEHYKDIYTLSEYFNVTNLITELDSIRERELCNDLDFTIQFLIDYQPANDHSITSLTRKLEIFLSKNINECMKNRKFQEMPFSNIFRIFERSEKGSMNQNSLLEFIIESASNRFSLFKFIELHKLTEDKFEELTKFIDKQEEATRTMYLEFLPPDLSFIKILKNKYDQLLKESNQTKFKYEQTKNELSKFKIKNDELNCELSQTKFKYEQTREEVSKLKIKCDELKEELNQTKEESNQTKIKYDETREELDETKIKNDELKEDIEKYKKQIEQNKDVIDRMKSEIENNTKKILVAGCDRCYGLGEKPNNKNAHGDPIISPPLDLPLDPSSILSFSVYFDHSVVVTRSGSLMGTGRNSNGRISPSLPKTVIDHFTEFFIKDVNGRNLVAVSAVCTFYGTVYIFTKSDNSGRHLVLCDCGINGGDPIFLDIGNHEPVSLFGGYSHAAAIGVEGEVIIINRSSVKNSPSSRIEAVSLPGGEKASSVACCDDSVFVLSSNGRVFESDVKNDGKGRVLKFSAVSELTDKKIVCVSGTRNHCLAVSKEGRVFGRGSNGDGRLGLGEETYRADTFREISSLRGCEIRAAYAGSCHSLFETREGKILACGFNRCGELLLSGGPSYEYVFTPTETTIKSGSLFCIAGNFVSAVFIGNSPPPNTPNTPNTPNMRVRDYK